ncbi:hypothetical protein [Bifidobacterium thermacidophilum]|uniref:hypothetical protein n=1 Tax=Bifidobacterium thermacidophilum TaxID=246618 RepID=UPI0005C69DE6|nr:hypothetical protein [Bifidobacterium thermacidophilum]
MTTIITHSQMDAEIKLIMASENTEVNIISEGRQNQKRNTICHALGKGKSTSMSKPLSYMLGLGQTGAAIPRPTATTHPRRRKATGRQPCQRPGEPQRCQQRLEKTYVIRTRQDIRNLLILSGTLNLSGVQPARANPP